MVQSELRYLWKAQSEPDLEVVLIPGAGQPSVEDWPFHSRKWLASILPREKRNVDLLTFDYKFPVDDSFSCENVWIHGERLLKALYKSQRPKSTHDLNKQTHAPILLVCHSLGGIILKQAFCVANAQLERHSHLINDICGIIFISTPHLSSDRSTTLEKTLLGLQATNKATLKVLQKRAEKESGILFDLAIRFKATQLRTPILSTYELTPTKIYEGRFKSKKVVVVDKTTSTTQLPEEELLGLPLDHVGVSQLDQCSQDTQKSMRDFIERSLADAEAHAISRAETEVAASRHDSIATTEDSADATYGSSSTAHEALTHAVSAMNVSEREPKLPCVILDTEYHNDEFYGRDDILRLIGDALLPPETKIMSSENEGLKQFALCGMGGMGKTEIATEFAIRNKEAFDALLWIRADEPAKLDSAFSRIATQLGLEDPAESKNHVVSREIVKGWLGRPWKMNHIEGRSFPADANWLIIFDNADDQYTLSDYWPMQGNGSVLITSRDPLAKSFFTATPSGIDLEPLSDDAGASLLKKMAHLEDTDKADLAKRISNTLGGLPLAISQMAGVIRRQDLSLAEFIESYEDAAEREDLHKTKYALGGKTTYSHTVSSVWAFENLEKSTLALLGSLSMLDPDAIPELLFSDIPTELSLEEFPTKAVAYRKARAELLQASLIKRYKDQNDFNIHRLVQDAFKTRMKAEDKAKTFWFTVGLIAKRWPSTMPPPTKRNAAVVTPRMWMVERWPMCEALYPHAMKLRQQYEEMGEQELPNPPLHFAALLQNAALYQFERGMTREMVSMLELGLRICDLCGDEAKSSVFVDTHFALGAVTAGTNDHNGSVYHHKCALEAQLETLEKEDVLDVRLARCYNELGTGRMEAGNLGGSIDAFLESLHIDKELGVYPYNWVCEANLGLSYTYVGDLQEAEVVLVGTLQRREERFGKDDTESYRPGRILHALARLREGQGRSKEAFELYSRSLTSLMATLGHHHHFTADCGHKVTQYAIKYQQYEHALKLIDQSLSFYKYEPECFKAEIARASFIHGRLMKLLGKEVKSRSLLKKAYTLRREIVQKEDKPDADLTLQNFDELVSVMHSGTRAIPKPQTLQDQTRLDNLIGPSP